MKKKESQTTAEKAREEKKNTLSHVRETDIAIIGMACRFPEAKNYTEFWENLTQGRSSIQEVPRDRWDTALYYSPDPGTPNTSVSKWGGFIEGVDQFDAAFFGISPREAECMDPQQRIMLELSWSCFEDASMCPSTLSGEHIGVFIGVAILDYKELQEQAGHPIDTFYGTGVHESVISNRISHYFNLRGPSMPVDTACSSSLSAIHLAIQSLHRGECSLALAGGVSVLLTPPRYISFSKMGILSPSGSCKTFDEDADGTVRGEGAGVILLKPLEQALRDHNCIHGILKGSAINHSGKTYTLSYPNHEAQAEVIVEAQKQAGITPESVSYIELHGTGTPKGDPIESQGLLKAFQSQKHTFSASYCGLGCVKPNIGHLEAAAGIAGVIKVLLCMKHKQLPELPNFKQLNHRISIRDTPFYIVEQLQEWNVRQGSTKQINPKRAGVSAFGFSGTNAHIVLEEYIPKTQKRPQITGTTQHPVIIVLSAINEERLWEQARQLSAGIREQRFSDTSLLDMAYTLQVGREAMKERLALLVGSLKELEEKLTSFIEGQEDVENLYQGQVKGNKETLAIFAADEDMAKTIDAWIHKGKHRKLIALWVKGLIVDWNKLYDNVKPRCISLPTYPFARERYWIPETEYMQSDPFDRVYPERSRRAQDGLQSAKLHPLLHQNISDFSEQRFSSFFTGQEFFLKDHVVNGQAVLPAVAYLEMARAAVARSSGFLQEKQAQSKMSLKNIIWARPIIVGEEAVHVHLALFPEDHGTISFEIFSESGEVSHHIHCQGYALLSPGIQAPALDIKKIQTDCCQEVLSVEELYEIFKTIGIEYGEGHRGIETLYAGSGTVLAKLSLPSVLCDTREQFVLHPSVLDSALQASIGLMAATLRQPFDSAQDGIAQDSAMPDFALKPTLPFALEDVEIFGPCTSKMYALIQKNESSKDEDNAHKFDIDVCDLDGQVCVRMKGFSSREIPEERHVFAPERSGSKQQIEAQEAKQGGTQPLVGSMMMIPVWEAVQPERVPIFPLLSERVLIVGDSEAQSSRIREFYPKAQILDIQAEDTIEALSQKLAVHDLIEHIVSMPPCHKPTNLMAEALIEQQNEGVLRFFRLIKVLLALGYESKHLGWTIITERTMPVHAKDAVNPAHASMYGLAGSLAQEYSHWKIRVLDVDTNAEWPLDDMFTLPADPHGNFFVCRNGQWHRQQLIPFQSPALQQSAYKKGGVYVIIGGAGGIGEAWSEYMMRTYQAQIVWIGRRDNDAVIQSKLDRLSAIGAAPCYIKADARDYYALRQAYEQIKQRYGKINGVIHSALVLSDQSLTKMDATHFQAALSAKVDVSVRLAQVFHQETLDFVLFFSSFNSFTKAAGQSNYAAGCTFEDAFAHQLSLEWECAVKVINWGYWGNTGVVASQEYRERMACAGIGSIESPEAMQVLEILLGGPMNQLAFIKTTRPLNMEGVKATESITCYDDTLPADQHAIGSSFLNLHKLEIPLAEKEQTENSAMSTMNDLMLRLLWSQLQSSGVFTETTGSIAELKRKAGLMDVYHRWLDESLEIFARNNYLQHDAESYVVRDAGIIDRERVWQEWEEHKPFWCENPSLKVQVPLVEATLRKLPDILIGKVPATDILFPDSSLTLVEGIYKESDVAVYFNTILVEIVLTYVETRLKEDASAAIRILEIGAGTGGTSAVVFQKLQPYHEHIQEYCYTDISKVFLLHGEKEYGAQYSYLTYKIFDVEHALAGQQIEAGEYDLVIAANVLHATRNIRQTLRNAKAALRSNGVLLLNELSANSLFTHLTFG
ncbi:MAG: SDR family NAD(P)-dependent oxidoreductase, partial [bacterium]|nr:SDR family NAD(P)-dependent oxidoreductase [bacterium]